MKHKLIPLTDKGKIYARPGGRHYHLNRECPMLQGGDFERLGYIRITMAEVKKRKLNPCMCAYQDFTPHKPVPKYPPHKSGKIKEQFGTDNPSSQDKCKLCGKPYGLHYGENCPVIGRVIDKNLNIKMPGDE
jgi:hypothetical protein